MAAAAQHVVGGLATGSVYALLALGVVLIHRASGLINVAQGELATLAAFICWTLIGHGWAFWPAFVATVSLAFGFGIVLQALLARPAQTGPPAGAALLPVGVLLAINGLDTWIWGGARKPFAGPFSAGTVHLGGVAVAKRDLGVLVVAGICFLLVAGLVQRTRLGLGLRAAAVSPVEAGLLGVPVAAMLAVTWGIATALAAVGGVMAAPSLHLGPSMMQTVLLYVLVSAVHAGVRSPAGAVVGGLLLGVALELLAAYVHWVGGELKPAAALALMLALLLARPSGLLARTVVRHA
jgi:branched-chain amino acid transport system permease protein